MSNLIGIISYLPDDKKIREHRLNCLSSLIGQCNYLFRLPIYIVIQNYTQEDITHLLQYKNVTLSQNYDKCGILGARRKLREYFINSNYNNLIMLDDDCVIVGGVVQAQEYKKQIDDNPNCFIEFNGTLLKLFCISKDIFKQVDYEDINPELEEGFEDRIFVNKLRKLYPERRRIFEHGLQEHSISCRDEYSTWYKEQNIDKMLEKTKIYEK